MKTVILNEDDLSVIRDALTATAERCEEHVRKSINTPQGKYLKVACQQSAEKYREMAMKLAIAEEILVRI